MDSENASSSSEWRLGWKTVAAATISYACGFGMFAMTAGLFIGPWKREFGWSTSAAAIAPVFSLAAAFSAPILGKIVDRTGPRLPVVVGLCSFGIAQAALACLPGDVRWIQAVAILLGVLGVAAGPVALTKGVSSWFQRRVGLAFGVTMSGMSLAGIIGVPLLSYIIAAYGWRVGYLTLSSIALLIGLPVALLFFHERGTRASVPQRAPERKVMLSQTPKSARFWLLAMSLGFAALPIGAFAYHLQPLLLNKGFAAQTAALIGSAFALSMLVGRLLAGYLVDRFWGVAVAAIFLSAAAVGALALQLQDPSDGLMLPILSVCLLGLANGAEMDFAAYFSLRLFDKRTFSLLFGLQSMLLTIFLAIGGFGASVIVDETGNYFLLGVIGSISFALSAATMLALGLIGHTDPCLRAKTAQGAL